jgi:hypothetical protein
MLDALFCCYIIAANVRQTGYFARAAAIFSRAVAWCRALSYAGGPSPRAVAAVAADCAFQDDWIKRLARLENYVAAMA